MRQGGCSITVAMRSMVHSSPVNPLAVAPSSRACSTLADCASDSRGEGPLGPRLRGCGCQKVGRRG
jgi:hypothetical protein